MADHRRGKSIERNYYLLVTFQVFFFECSLQPVFSTRARLRLGQTYAHEVVDWCFNIDILYILLLDFTNLK